MKISHWFIVAGFVAPLFACSASDDGNSGGGGSAGSTGGSGGSVIPSGGTGGENTGGSGNSGNTGGTSTGGGGTGGTGAGGTTVEECKASGYTDPMCGACMEANCATECEACMSDPACMGWLSCVINNSCEDQACYDACTGQYPGGDVSALAWFGNSGCIGTKCGSQCGMDAGDCGPGGYQPGPCGECLGTKCVAQCEACLADPACSGWLSCVINNDCETQACYDACDAQYPGGQAPALDWLGNSGCVGTQCGTECEVGGGASCEADGYTDPACGACMATNCKAECEACLASTACVGWLNCVIDNDCETEACYNDCTSKNPGGDSLALAWFGTEGCISKCATECN